MSIKSKLIAAFSIIILFIGLAAYMTGRTSQQALINSLGHYSVLLSKEVIRGIEREFFYGLAYFQEYASSEAVRRALIESNQAFENKEDRASFIARHDKVWRSLPRGVNDPFAAAILQNPLSRGIREKIARYRRYYGSSLYGEVFITNRYGVNVGMSQRTSDYRQDDEAWWQDARETGRYVGPVEFDQSVGSYAVAVGLRIDDDHGRFLGVMKIVYDFRTILRMMDDTRRNTQYKSIVLQLVTRDGRVICESPGGFRQGMIEETLRQKIRSVSEGFDSSLVTKGMKTEGLMYGFAASQGHRSFPDLGWVLIVRHDAGEILFVVDALKRQIAVIALGAILVAFVMGVFISGSIAGPLLNLERVAREVGKGRLDVDIPVKSRDEIGHLARTFQRMVNDLNKLMASHDELDKEVQDRKKIEEELRQANEDLRVSERTSRAILKDLQKAHQELQQTQMQLLRSEKLASIGQLAAGVAHEINNPVGFINSNLQTLAEYVEGIVRFVRQVEKGRLAVSQGDWQAVKKICEDLKRCQEEIDLDFILGDIGKLIEESRQGVERVKKIVMDLRTFAREDKDDKEWRQVEEIIDSVVNIVYNEFKYKADLVKDYGQTPKIPCYPQRLGQVFINLLINAAQAIKEQEKGTITIRTSVQDGFVRVAFEDSGEGIPQNKLHKIFDPFFTTKPVGQGTGLGLSISYDIIKQHNGEIHVRSVVGQGTVFTVTLPCRQEQGEDYG